MEWTRAVQRALVELMIASWHPSHHELDDALAATEFESPSVDETGMSVSKPKRIRAAFLQADAQGKAAVDQVVIAIIQELPRRGVFDGPYESEQVPQLVDSLRELLAAGGLILAKDGSITRGAAHVEVDTGGRATVERLLTKLRDPSLDPGAVIGTSKDLLEATAKHLLHEFQPETRAGDMSGVVSQGMKAAGLSTQSPDIEGPDARGIAKARSLVYATAEAVTMLRNRAGDGHGHVELSSVSREMAEYIRHMTLAAVQFQLSSVASMKRAEVSPQVPASASVPPSGDQW